MLSPQNNVNGAGGHFMLNEIGQTQKGKFVCDCAHVRTALNCGGNFF